MAKKAAVGGQVLDLGLKAVAQRAQALQRLKVEYVDIESIKPNSYNPNRQTERDFELLLLSMREDGFTQPIVVQRATREIVDGEHRWRAARHLGLATVPIVLVDQTAEQMKVSTLRHNRARGSEDIELSIQVLRDLRTLGALDWAQSSLMIDDTELQRLMDDVAVPDALAGDEYSEGWSPTKVRFEKDEGAQGGDSMSDEARTRTEQLQAKLAAAETPKERAGIENQIRKDIYRLQCVYEGAEAALLRTLLEPKPAQKLLQFCKEYQALEM